MPIWDVCVWKDIYDTLHTYTCNNVCIYLHIYVCVSGFVFIYVGYIEYTTDLYTYTYIHILSIY